MQITLLRHPLTVALSSTLLLSACGNEREPQLASAGTPSSSTISTISMTSPRHICGVDPETDQISPAIVIDNSNELVALHSVSQAANDLLEAIQSRISDPFTQIAYLQIPTRMAGTAMTDALFMFNGMYQCTPDLLQQNGCNWSLPSGGNEGFVFVSTTVSNAQDYKAEVRRGMNRQSAIRILTLEGTVGDAGNLVMTAYEGDGTTISSIRASERSNDGEEHVTFNAANLQHSASESSNCSGSLSMSYEGYQLSADWRWANNRTSGTVVYNAGNGDIQLNW